MRKIITTTAVLLALSAPAMAGKKPDCRPNCLPDHVQGPKGDTGPQGVAGDNGTDGDQGPKGDTGAAGRDGTNGLNGIDAVARYSVSQNAADRGLASLQTRTAKDGQWTGALGLAGSDDLDAIAGGVRYGFTDRMDGYAVLSVPFSGSDVAWGVGVTFILGGN